MERTVGAIRKSESAEVRVSRGIWKGRPVVDVRVWYVPASGGDYVPSRKGLTIDAGKLPELVALLSEAV
ncbi:transcriptional coactivator p15/PC4 family protein [Sulfuritalea hydrogenivorans]|uniref:Transcriptional coactivator p15 (PC4) C-terminal domain-containing protein n=1 Tax=Sulfuritalea hydrogenivorans sk43H TaxID=1223802 RepID=W0SEC5_9PROT|nr:hypothetical protein SUTH_01593 [Sulfuritalea hydrogenivorans sk43H]